MQRLRLRNEYVKLKKTGATRIAYNKQRNVCVNIPRKSKKSYCEKLDTKNIIEIKNSGVP